jgi:hypothetical protein
MLCLNYNDFLSIYKRNNVNIKIIFLPATLYGCESEVFQLREELKWITKYRVVGRQFGPS